MRPRHGSSLVAWLLCLAVQAHAQGTVPSTAAPTSSADQQALQQMPATFKAEFDKGNAAGLAAMFAEGGQVVGADGSIVKGRESITKQYADFFKDRPNATVELKVESLKFLTPDVAQEEGVATVTLPDAEPSDSRYSVLYVKKDGKWSQQEVRDYPMPDDVNKELAEAVMELENPISQLDWMIGDWVDESPDAVITHSCRYVLGGKFILRQYVAQRGDEPASEGVHLIGYDPQTGLITSWGFDAEGSHGKATWAKDGDHWVVKMTGVLADGSAVSATQLIGQVNNDTIRMSAVDRTIGGEIAPDREEVFLVRKPPAPTEGNDPADGAKPEDAAAPAAASAPAATPAPATTGPAAATPAAAAPASAPAATPAPATATPAAVVTPAPAAVAVPALPVVPVQPR